MTNRFLRQCAFLIVVVTALGVFFVEADAQTSRRRRSRRVTTPRPVVTNPPIAPVGEEQSPDGDADRIISTSDETPNGTEGSAETATKPKTTRTAAEERDMKQTINSLSNQVNQLNEKLGKMQENDKSLLDMERLTRAEQRSENLRSQQIDVESKLADLGSKLEQVEFSIRPENIERSAAGYGTTRPEEARDARRRALENERTRLQAQIRILETSRIRLEQALVNADAEVDALRRKLEQQRAQEAVAPPSTETPSTTRPRPE